ncbi:UDP-N-acetylmuramoyl-L-alanyl-D-glutamate--2,6-diaminopimelate ligase [Peribacillus asahii]|uniref:UDP-N-acetylmuramoyl-L-alanyl-D-glutamate--2, 6-diaminopimelate ligase n=1 Tax=Peribacillus asahii TaxID=228899 RepID=A0A398BFU4_9BACI|nr:UDP-N-acetylmuramoyl-L-alanyl-D-glutamate--2,6-diaminopimelate ligase [Peribacillus asahii]RID89135.1 UDP-N-acetylmuramoyl-L-alanyl-D-glutamate--2,6-diaminopimelate ligase [Peribacillus asahii]
MKLSVLLECIEKLTDESVPNINIEGISTNSAAVRPNEVFVAIPGYRVDGHDFIEAAIKAGASVIVGEKDLKDLPVPYIKVSNSRLALAKLACQFYEHPSRKKILIGITGTNGKTTTAFMLKYILETLGRTCSVFGTVHNVINGQASPSQNTTPDALELQRLLALSEDEFVIMEVSSHGLSQYRVEGVEFDYCLFTNLDHDHLDYHHDMDEYFLVKAKLFNQLKPHGKAIVNHYNSWGEKLVNLLNLKDEDICIIGDERHHHLKIDKIKSDVFTLVFERNQCFNLNLKMLGYHNILNASMAFLTAQKIGLPSSQIIQALEMFPGVPGRFEMMQHPNNGATIVIDYAHTADAFYHCLQTARDEGAKRVFHIYGFRGNRDTDKRKEMVNLSQTFSDSSVLTLDDLNGVSYDDMEQDLYKLNQSGSVIPDRTLAIKNVLDQVDEGDWVFITGKGAETYQQQFELPTASDIETVQYIFQQLDGGEMFL